MAEFEPDAPLRLAEALRIAFPNGGMTVSGLRREAARGRLTIERIAGKDFTTLNNIAAMREACVVKPAKQPATDPGHALVAARYVIDQLKSRGKEKKK